MITTVMKPNQQNSAQNKGSDNGGFKHTELGWIPVDWDYKSLFNYLDFISYGFTNPMPTANSGVFMITANDIKDGKLQLKNARKTSLEAYQKLLTDKSRPIKDDILLTKDGTLGRLALVGVEKICINQSVAVLRSNGKVFPLFLKKLLESEFYQREMILNAGGSTIKHIYITVVDKMLVALPSTLAEQTAIATALSDMDALIEAQERLITKKRALKQGVMQELLKPNEGWEEHELGSRADVLRGGSPRPIESFLTKDEHGINWVKIGDVKKGAKFISSTEEKIKESGVASSRMVNKGDFLISNSMSFGRPYIMNISGCIHDGWLVIQTVVSG